MSLAMVYDSNYWAIVIRNINAGGGLYDYQGYYYTPVWGYILGLANAFQNLFLGLGESAVRVEDIFYFEDSEHQTTATVTYLAFNYLTKVPLLIADTVLAYLAYVLTRDFTHDSRKAATAFALVYLCPVIIGSSAVIGMPDSISAMFMMMSVMLVMRGRNFLGGACFSMAALTKFFPVFLLFPLVAYVLSRRKGDLKTGAADVAMAAAGVAAVALIIFAPQIIDGNIADAFRFISDRTGSSSGSGSSSVLSFVIGRSRIIVYLLVIAASALVARAIYRADAKDLDTALLRGSMITMALTMAYPPATQYICVVVPLLAVYAVSINRDYMLSWKLLAVGATVVMTVSLSTHLLPIAVSTGWIEVSSLAHFFDVWNAGGTWSVWNVQFVIGSIFQYFGSFSILLFAYYGRFRRYLAERRGADPA